DRAWSGRLLQRRRNSSLLRVPADQDGRHEGLSDGVCGGKEKERATAMLLGDSKGNKYSPTVIFKTQKSKLAEVAKFNTAYQHGFGKTVWKEIKTLQESTGMEIYGDAAAWWNSDMSIQFLKLHFGAREDVSRPILLLLDDFSGHWTEEVKAYARSIKVHLLKVPPSATSACQPADVAWMRPLKVRLRRYWVEFLRKQIEDNTCEYAFKMTAPARSIIAEWIYNGWNELSGETIMSGYRRAHQLQSEEQKRLDIDTMSVIRSLESLNLLDSSVGVLDPENEIDGGGVDG
ncbi:hypothetical protein BBJ28_00011669, partial [Nothophytophthora sp. Chile5]